MDKRQKIILGVAAAFMLAFTIIGVTYAFFLTRVSYTDGTATAIINTATIGASYKDDNQTVVIDDALPGAVVYKSFTVNNESSVPVPFSIVLTTKLNTTYCSDGTSTTQTECTTNGGTWDTSSAKELPQFVHSEYASGTCSNTAYTNQIDCTDNSGTWTINSDLASTCYVSAASNDNDPTKPTACYSGSEYNNILVQLFRIDGSSLTRDEFLAIEWNDTTSANYKNFETYSATKVSVTTDENDDLISIEAPFNNSLSASGEGVFLNRKNGTTQESIAGKAANASDPVSNYYVLKVTYVNVNKNQNIENNASVSLKVDISATNTSNSVAVSIPYEEDTLAYKLINSAASTGIVSTSNKTENVELSTLQINNESSDNTNVSHKFVNNVSPNILADAIISKAKYSDTITEIDVTIPSSTNESLLFTTDDNYTSSTNVKSYVYRGNVDNNYLTFANMCWRIVRIEGDGSIKLILADGDAPCSSETTSKTYSGYIIDDPESGWSSIYLSSEIDSALSDWYTEKGLSSYQSSHLKNEVYYSGTQTYYGYVNYEDNGGVGFDCNYYDVCGETKPPSLTSLISSNFDLGTSAYIGMLSDDEVAMSGGARATSNPTWYLKDNAQADLWWTISGGAIVNTRYDGGIPEGEGSGGAQAIRPSITLKAGVEYKSGDGSVTNAYQVK